MAFLQRNSLKKKEEEKAFILKTVPLNQVVKEACTAPWLFLTSLCETFKQISFLCDLR